MYFEVKQATHVDGYRVRLRFEDGSAGVADLSSYPNKHNVFEPFLDLAYFRRFRVEHGTLVWGDGEVDIAPETLYMRATGKTVEYGTARTTA